MKPGILVKHEHHPRREHHKVRCDVTAILGIVPKGRWPEGAQSGDFCELVLHHMDEFWRHPDRELFDPSSGQALQAFFANGGDTAHLFGICVESQQALKTTDGARGVLSPLLDRLCRDEDIGLIVFPAVAYMRCEVDRLGRVRADAEGVYEVLLSHCQQVTNRFLIMDTPQGLHGEPLENWVAAFRARNPDNRAYGALYYPWVFDRQVSFPPSGAMAGHYARLELDNPGAGVALPPANRPVLGITHAEVELDGKEAAALADQAINPLVVQPGRGIVAFGARTLSKDINFRFINARRVTSMVCEHLRRSTEWAVFENNTHELWAILRRDVWVHLQKFFEAGLLADREDGDNFDVHCDAETNPPARRNTGEVNVKVMMKPVGAIEQIVVDLRIGRDTLVGGE
jgi:hypothetical protein